MEEPIQWIYQAGTGCSYCKDGLCERMNQLMEGGHSIRQASRVMSKECEDRYKSGTIRKLFYDFMEARGNKSDQKPRQIKDDPEYYTPLKYIKAAYTRERIKIMVKYLESFETPANQCDTGEIYVKDQGDGTWNVAQWDGAESWDFGDDAIFTSREEAEAEAEEWLRQVGR